MNRLAPAEVHRRASREIEDLVRDVSHAGLLDELRLALQIDAATTPSAAQLIRDFLYELASAKNRDLAVDVLLHATGIAEFECRTLRHYARKHAMTAEGFRKHVQGMRERLHLPQPHATNAN